MDGSGEKVGGWVAQDPPPLLSELPFLGMRKGNTRWAKRAGEFFLTFFALILALFLCIPKKGVIRLRGEGGLGGWVRGEWVGGSTVGTLWPSLVEHMSENDPGLTPKMVQNHSK